MSGISARRFKGFPAFGHLFPEVGLGGFHGKTQFLRRAFDEANVRRGLAPAQAVIEMADDYMAEARLFEQVHQRHRIQPTRNPNEPTLPALGGGRPRDGEGGGHFVFSNLILSPVSG